MATAAIYQSPDLVKPRTAASTILADKSKAARDADIATGEQLASKYYDTPQMADILARYQSEANGLSSPEYQTLYNRGNSDINTALQTGLRQLRSSQAAAGIHGGAAGGQSLQLLANINNQREKLASDLASQDIALKRQGLSDYANFYGNNLAAKLGTAYGYAGLGATDRASAEQATLGRNYIDYLNKSLMPQAPTSQVILEPVKAAASGSNSIISTADNNDSSGGAFGGWKNFGRNIAAPFTTSYDTASSWFGG